MNHQTMAVYDENDWAQQQAIDEANEKRAVTEAYERIYLAINRLEALDNCSYTSLRSDVRLTELVLFRK